MAEEGDRVPLTPATRTVATVEPLLSVIDNEHLKRLRGKTKVAYDEIGPNDRMLLCNDLKRPRMLNDTVAFKRVKKKRANEIRPLEDNLGLSESHLSDFQIYNINGLTEVEAMGTDVDDCDMRVSKAMANDEGGCDSDILSAKAVSQPRLEP